MDRFFDASLVTVIGELGWTVPPSGFVSGGKRGRENAIMGCIKELRKHVGSRGERVIEVEVLKNGSCSWSPFRAVR